MVACVNNKTANMLAIFAVIYPRLHSYPHLLQFLLHAVQRPLGLPSAEDAFTEPLGHLGVGKAQGEGLGLLGQGGHRRFRQTADR